MQSLSWSFIVCGVAVAFSGANASADIVTFQSIPGAAGANDMSPDGRYIVGDKIGGGTYVLDTVTNVMTTLPPAGSSAVAVSDNGQVVLGSMHDPVVNAEVAAMWTAASGVWTSLGYLPNAMSCPSRSNGYELSADGTVAVGLSWDGCSGRGFRWTQATGMIELQNLANGNNRASVCSANGNVIGGFAQGSFSRTPAVWTGTGSGQLIDPPNGDVLGEIHGINEAGTLLLGVRNGKAATWTYPALTMSIVGAGSALPGWEGIPQGIADNGLIVGFDFLSGNRRAWIHPAGAGPLVDLNSYITNNGGTVPEGMALEVCQAVSRDGRHIIGHGFGTGAWRVTIDYTNCVADIARNNAVDVSDLLAVINGWGACPGVCPPHCAADINPVTATAVGNCTVDVSDLLAVINGWGPCPPPVGGCCTGTACTQLTAAACATAGGVYLGNGVPCGLNACTNNDACANAIDITDRINGFAELGDNSTATPGIFGGGDPELPAGSPTCHWNENPGAIHSTVWYKFTAPPTGSVSISLCTSVAVPFFDSILTVYSGACGSLVEYACDEDQCNQGAAPYFSHLSLTGLVPGATYRICVMNPGDWSGSMAGPFRLTITSP